MHPGGLGDEGQQPLAVHGVDSGECWCHLTLRGELGFDSAPLLRQALEEAVGRGRNQVSIDAAGVTFIDSSALMVILAARRELIAGGGTLYLAEASPPVTRILEIAMLTDLLIDVASDESSGEQPPPVDRG